jgi:hypothetical protein
MPHSHRSGNQKQTNKPHKGGGGRKAQAHRTEGKQVSLKGRHDKDAARTGRIDRANQAKQRREQKRGAIWLQKRVGGGAAAPRIALWVPLSPHADCLAVQHTLQAEAAGSTAGVKFVQHPDPCAQSVDMATMHFSQYKQRITFIHPPERSALAVLELAKVADIVILVLPVQQGIEQSIDKVSLGFKDACVHKSMDHIDSMKRLLLHESIPSVLIAAAPLCRCCAGYYPDKSKTSLCYCSSSQRILTQVAAACCGLLVCMTAHVAPVYVPCIARVTTETCIIFTHADLCALMHACT